jgi:hypothetical protein
MLGEVLPAQERFTECVDAAAPVPLSASVIVDGVPSLVKVSLALALPATGGLKVTANETLWPAAIVVGSDNPPTVKEVLLEVAPVTVTLPSVAVSVPEAVALDPATTLPSPRVAGVTLSCGPELPDGPVLTP